MGDQTWLFIMNVLGQNNFLKKADRWLLSERGKRITLSKII